MTKRFMLPLLGKLTFWKLTISPSILFYPVCDEDKRYDIDTWPGLERLFPVLLSSTSNQPTTEMVLKRLAQFRKFLLTIILNSNNACNANGRDVANPGWTLFNTQFLITLGDCPFRVKTKVLHSYCGYYNAQKILECGKRSSISCHNVKMFYANHVLSSFLLCVDKG